MWDGHLESQKNPDRLKRSIHVDRIGGLSFLTTHKRANTHTHSLCICVCMFVHVCVCVCERERESKRRKRERKGEEKYALTQTFHKRSWSVDGTSYESHNVTFIMHPMFATLLLAYVLESLVRVSRQAGRSHLCQHLQNAGPVSV